MKKYRVKAEGKKDMKRAPKFLEVKTYVEAKDADMAVDITTKLFRQQFKAEPDYVEVEPA